ncbi:MAG: hypothetical protein HQK93_07540, partial [Nitrospirae bacterium]|nr:hypothetical protein [Nitrospirota bacterium]
MRRQLEQIEPSYRVYYNIMKRQLDSEFIYHENYLRISDTIIESGDITKWGKYKEFESLKCVEFEHCNKLETLELLENLTELETLWINDCQSLINLKGLKNLTGIKELFISDCKSLTNIEE